MTMKKALAPDVVKKTAVPDGWKVVRGAALVRELKFADWKGAIAFVNRVSVVAEAMNHHPDVELGWGRVALRLTTHDAQGLTLKDFELAQKIAALEHEG